MARQKRVEDLDEVAGRAHVDGPQGRPDALRRVLRLPDRPRCGNGVSRSRIFPSMSDSQAGNLRPGRTAISHGPVSGDVGDQTAQQAHYCG